MLRQTERTTPHSRPNRVSFDRELAHAVLDAALTCHVAFVQDGGPVVIPTTHWRIGDRLHVHGGRGSRLARVLASGAPVSVAVTVEDGLVLARSAFHHSMNYRSVVLFGCAVEVTDPEAKAEAFRHAIDKLVPGRSALVRPPTERELAATIVAALPIDEGSAKMRSGPPVEDEADLAQPVWAGVIPLSLARGVPVADPHVPAGLVAGFPA